MVEKSILDEDKEGKAVDPSHYRGMIDTLLYLIASRPDLQFATCMCARYQDSSITLTAFADADHAGCQDIRRSTSGCLQFLRDRLISWSSKRQKSAAISSSKAEYIALFACCAQILWMGHKLPITASDSTRFQCTVITKAPLPYAATMSNIPDIFTKALDRERIEFSDQLAGHAKFYAEDSATIDR
uniref:Reverse transcriptase domain-containing protein n=1 Tax=Tanacetum cinerariifolium TaxID=118510 RepID=A0A6L2P4S0_TANCI|nr:hypothetical protein [Tanacetum cinerariifolium]